jgi:hypothetical protein
MNDADLYRLLETLDEEGLENARLLVTRRLEQLETGEPVGRVDYTDAERYDSRLNIIKPFLARLWDDAYDAGKKHVYRSLKEQYRATVPTANPFKDAP